MSRGSWAGRPPSRCTATSRRVMGDSLDDFSRLTVTSFSSLVARQVITELDHELDDEILCKL
jgi:hypothetical protein